MSTHEAPEAFLWYPRRFLQSRKVKMKLTGEEELWYRRALDNSWFDEGMPADPKEFADVVERDCTPEAAQKIISMFFEPKKGDPKTVVNPFQEELREDWNEKQSKYQKGGIHSGRKRREIKRLGDEQPNL